MASNELAAKLQRRNNIIDAAEEGKDIPPPQQNAKFFNVYTEFKEFSRKQIQSYQAMFNQLLNKYYSMEMMRGAPQTHLALKEMIKEVDEDHDNKISFREFLLIFRKAAAGELEQCSGLMDLYQQVNEIDVDKEGVTGAKSFFESKINQVSASSKFEAEIRQEQEERKQEEAAKKKRAAAFKEKTNLFQNIANTQ